MALICVMGKPGEGMTFRLRNGQSGAGMLPSRTSAPALTASPLSEASTDTSARACARAGSVFATPVGNHGGNDL